MTADQQNYLDFEQIKRTERKRVMWWAGWAGISTVLTQALAILSLVENRKEIPIENQLWILSQMSFVLQGMMVFYWLSKVPHYFSTDQYGKIKHYVFLALSCVTGLFIFITELENFLLCPNSEFQSEEERNEYIEKVVQNKKEARNTSIVIFISFVMQLGFASQFSSCKSIYCIFLFGFSICSLGVITLKTLPEIVYFSDLPEAILASAPSLQSTPKSLTDEEFVNKQKELELLSIFISLMNEESVEGIISVVTRIDNILIISMIETELEGKYLFIPIISYSLIFIFGIYEIWFNYCVVLPNFSKLQKICITLLISINGEELFMGLFHTMKYKKCQDFEERMKKMKKWHEIGMLFFENVLMLTYVFLAKQEFHEELESVFNRAFNVVISLNFLNNPLSLVITFIIEKICKCAPCCSCWGSQCYCCKCCMCSCCECCNCCACCCCLGQPETISSAERVLSVENSLNNMIQVEQIMVQGTENNRVAQDITSIEEISHES